MEVVFTLISIIIIIFTVAGGRQGEGQAIDPNKVKWQGKVDSKGFRILTAQVIDLQRVPEDTVLQILKKNIIFENGIVILNCNKFRT